MAKLDGIINGPWDTGFDIDAEMNALDDLINTSNSLPDGEIVNGVIKFPVADGYAFYLVSKEHPLTLKHIPFGDAWEIPDAHVRGLTKDDVVDILRSERKLNALFATRKDVS